MVALAERLGFTLPGYQLMLLVTVGLSVGCYQAVIALKKQYADYHMGHHTDANKRSNQ